MKRGRKIAGIDMALPDGDTHVIMGILKDKGEISIGGLGKFQIVNIKSRTLYHNTAKKKIKTKSYNKLKYTPSKLLKAHINA